MKIILGLFWCLPIFAFASDECSLDPNVSINTDMIVENGKTPQTCVLNIVCGGSPKSVYCKSLDGSSCPSVSDCYSERLELNVDSKQPNLKPEEPKKEGDVTAYYLDAPAVLNDNESGAVGSCVGDEKFSVKEKKGIKTGVSSVVCGAIGRSSCPSAMSCSKDKSRSFLSSTGRSPSISTSSRRSEKSNPANNSSGESGSGGTKGGRESGSGF